MNDTTIVLIPKLKSPFEHKDFHPISLCNVIYEMISKCLVNSICLFLGRMLLATQSAFILAKVITDNALISFEFFIIWTKDHKENFYACKLDTDKTYDRVD